MTEPDALEPSSSPAKSGLAKLGDTLSGNLTKSQSALARRRALGTVYLLIDCSSSMADGRKLEQAKRGSLRFFGRGLEAVARGRGHRLFRGGPFCLFNARLFDERLAQRLGRPSSGRSHRDGGRDSDGDRQAAAAAGSKDHHLDYRRDARQPRGHLGRRSFCQGKRRRTCRHRHGRRGRGVFGFAHAPRGVGRQGGAGGARGEHPRGGEGVTQGALVRRRMMNSSS